MSEKRFIVENERTVYDNLVHRGYVCSWKTDAQKLVGLLNEQQATIHKLQESEKDKIIKDLETEDKRLCNIISNLHTEIASYNDKIKKQERVINTQQDIINSLIELIGIIQ